MKRLLLSTSIVLFFLGSLSLSFGFSLGGKPQETGYDLYYKVRTRLETETIDDTVKGMVKVLRTRVPENSAYINDDVVRKALYEDNLSALRIIMAEQRRKQLMDTYGAIDSEVGGAEAVFTGAKFPLHIELSKIDKALKRESSYLFGYKLTSESPDAALANNEGLATLFPQEETQRAQDELKALYQGEKDLAELRASLKGEHAFNTMFMNGNTEDSFYDLVEDLNELDRIWNGQEAKPMEASWTTPQGLGDDYQDPRDTSLPPSSNTPRTINITSEASTLSVPRTNTRPQGAPYTLAKEAKTNTHAGYFSADPAERPFIPTAENGKFQPPFPTQFNNLCAFSKILCVKIDIQVMSYDLFGSRDNSIRAQLKGAADEVNNMSQKNLALKTVTKTLFEPPQYKINLPSLLDMNIIISTRPISTQKKRANAMQRATELKALLESAQSTIAQEEYALSNKISTTDSAQALITEEFSSIDSTYAEKKKQAYAQAEMVVRNQTKDEYHDTILPQVLTMQSILKSFTLELGHISEQSGTIHEKPSK